MATNRAYHPWHDCDVGKDSPDIVTAMIEIPARSKVKYTCRSAVQPGMLFCESILYCSIVYPHDFGFIPKTLCEDNCALELLVLMQEKVVPMCLLRCKPIGAIRMVENGVTDVKIIAVCPDDPMFNHYNDISDLSEHRFKEIKAFFEDYKRNQHPELEEEPDVLPPDEGCFSPRVALKSSMTMKKRASTFFVEEELVGAKEAKVIIEEAMALYLTKFPAATPAATASA